VVITGIAVGAEVWLDVGCAVGLGVIGAGVARVGLDVGIGVIGAGVATVTLDVGL
jgi:hypothetical protein